MCAFTLPGPPRESGVVVPGMWHVPPHSVVVPRMRQESVNEACSISDVPLSRHIYSSF